MPSVRSRPQRCPLVLLLVLALLLAACGRATPRVTLDDARGGNTPSDTIWIPETRHVDPGPDPRAGRDDDGRPERDPDDAGASPDPARDGGSDASAASGSERPDAALDPGDAGRGDGDATGPRSAGPGPASGATPDDAGAGPGDGAPGNGDDADGTPEDESAEIEGPVEPEPTADCGTPRREHRPSRAEAESAARALAEEVAARWPDTHAGVWVTDGAGFEVHAAFTEEVGTRLAVLCERFEHPELLRGVTAPVSARELDELHARAVAERDALRDGEEVEGMPDSVRATDGRYEVRVALARNALVVVVDEPTDELAADLRARYTPQLYLEPTPSAERPGDAEERGDAGRAG